MSAPPSMYESNLNRREEIAVSGAALSEAPWKLAGTTGVVVAGADLVTHLAFHLLSFRLEWVTALSMGVVAFWAVAGAGALVRSRRSRALRWARSRPWRFAVAPGAAAAVIVFVLAVLDGSGVLGGAFTAIWHGTIAYGLTGLVGSVVRPRREARD